MLAALLVTGIALAPAPTVVAEPGPDSLEAIEHVKFVLSQYYRRASTLSGRSRWNRRDELGQAFDQVCDGDRDDVCFADDPDAGRCPNFVQCHPTPRHMLEALAEATTKHPDSGFLTGQTVYLLAKLGRLAEARTVVDACQAERWWCDALEGYVLHYMREDARASASMRRSMDAAPDSVRCKLTDATWVFGSWSQRGATTSVPDVRDDTKGWDCRRRIAVADTVWWLSDPLYSVPGNDRYVEQVTRAMSARFHDEIRRTLPSSPGPQSFLDHLWAERVRRGPLDSYDSRRSMTWTSRAAARYHFVPDVEPDDLGNPVWRLEADLDDEGYTPDAADFIVIPHQIARFRAGDSLRVAAAALVDGSKIDGALDATATLILTDGPESMPLRLSADGKADRPTFLGQAPSRRYIAGVEVVTSKGVGWSRRPLESLTMSGPEISDLLLYTPEGGPEEPTDLLKAAAAMRGSTTVEEDATVGIYWEVYGAPDGSTLEFELSVERASGGLVDRLRRLLPGGPQEGRGAISWTEPVQGNTHGTAVTVDLRDLRSGEYSLILKVGWNGRQTLERRRTFEVE